MKNPVENELLSALRELEKAATAMATETPKPNLLPIFSRIDELTKNLPTNADPTLLHYLHKKSYEKARQHLELKIAG